MDMLSIFIINNSALHMHNSRSTFKDVVCFSHLRWDFVFQRPQHLLGRFAKHYRVFYIEEPVFTKEADKISIKKSGENVWIVVPQLQHIGSQKEIIQRQKTLLSIFFEEVEISDYIFWYYTPMAISISDHFNPQLIVYDCMDELSAFKFASPLIKEKENELLHKADIVFTGGYSLYESKKRLHKNIYPFPSSIDKEHFLKARTSCEDPEDQAGIPHPRIGYFGVIDERMDIDLVTRVARAKPEWQFVIIGPVIKIDPETLPVLVNIHYLGSKQYHELPLYLSGWDIAMIPFVRNESTRYISPTKTPEYLAAGKPVISTSIQDVVSPYGNEGLVHIADTAQQFIKSAEMEFAIADRSKWYNNVDSFLAGNSWDNTWKHMVSLLMNTMNYKAAEKVSVTQTIYKKEKIYV